MTLTAAEDADLANGSAVFDVTSTGLTTVSVTGTEIENATLTVSLNKSSVSEAAGAGAATGTVTRNNADLSSALVVTLASNDTTEATVPATVTIPAGQMTAAFAIAAIDDAIVDGTQLVTFTASAAGFVSGTTTFSVTDAPPPVPVITAPTASGSSLRPVITWNASLGADTYYVWIDNQSTGTTPFLTTMATGTSYTPSIDLGVGNFIVWIRAQGAEGNSAWTSPYTFSITKPPTLIPVALQQSTNRPTISWEPLPGAVKYDIWIDNHLAGISQYIRNQNVAGTSFTSDSDMPLGLYRVWVRGIAQNGMTTAWSAMSQFYVVTAPTITGGNQSTFDRTPTFEWSAVRSCPLRSLYSQLHDWSHGLLPHGSSRH